MRPFALILSLLLLGAPALAADPVEEDYYALRTFPLPEKEVIEPGGFQLLPDGRLAVSTRRGEIWLIADPFAADPAAAKWTRFAHGLHEVLGLAWRDGWLYAGQRGEVTRLKDTTGDGQADLFETVCDAWGITGDYHEYAFLSKFDKQGNLWLPLCLTGSFSSETPYRGWCVRVTPDGEMIPTCSGLRSPGGVGFNDAGDIFYTDNQGPWNGTCSLKHLRPGTFVGHPGGNRWYDLPAAKAALGEKPLEPESGSRTHLQADRIPQYRPAAILFPYSKMGQSASGIACETSNGAFGPFAGQLFVGDQTHSTLMRVCLETVNGEYQGACFPFRRGFSSGIVPVELATNADTGRPALFAGGTSRGWGSRGGKEFAVERLDWTGKTPFEIRTMSAQHDGFLLTFTRPIDKATAGEIASYRLSSYTYIYQASYGSPEVDHTSPTITAITVAEDGLSARLTVTGLQRGHVHELIAAGVRSADGLPLLHPEAYYTLNEIPRAPSEPRP